MCIFAAETGMSMNLTLYVAKCIEQLRNIFISPLTLTNNLTIFLRITVLITTKTQ